MNKKLNLDTMSVDEMWELHEEISRVLSVRLTSEKRELEKRLAQLHREKALPAPSSDALFLRDGPRQRRKYPQVLPKYQNPNKPSETWSGRGKQPHWFTAALKAGRTIQDLAIVRSASKSSKSGRRLG